MYRTKKALLVGINYTGTEAALNGCINDVKNVQQLLITKFGYKEADITMLTDETELHPTRNNILAYFLDLLLSDNSDLYFHYSGHGSQIKDDNCDEKDGSDEALVPIDYLEAGLITDDELRGVLQCMKATCKLTIVLDCCHSGTGIDLAYNLYERMGKNYLLADSTTKMATTRGQVVCISGCMDNQTSADAYISTEYQGALTNSFINAMNTVTGKSRTFNNIYNAIKTGLRTSKYTQIPCLSSGTLVDINSVMNL